MARNGASAEPGLPAGVLCFRYIAAGEGGDLMTARRDGTGAVVFPGPVPLASFNTHAPFPVRYKPARATVIALE